jgi:hypothetical protein
VSIAVDLRDSASPSVRTGTDILLGEIHTGILQNSGPASADVVEQLLSRVANQPVRHWERPVRHAAAPSLLTGVDCLLPTTSGFARRAVGTLATDACISVGQLLQASAYTGVTTSREGRRLAWSHYLSHPGSLEALGDVRSAELVDGFLAVEQRPGHLDLAGVCAGVMADVQRSSVIDRGRPLRAARTQFRWAVVARSGKPSFRLTIGPGGLRSLQLGLSDPDGAAVRDLCLDVALHDWLLSSVIEAVDVANIGYRGRSEVVDRLRPIVDHLLHAWMPGARLPGQMRSIREEIDREAGLSRQWGTLMHRIRDQLSLAGLR